MRLLRPSRPSSSLPAALLAAAVLCAGAVAQAARAAPKAAASANAAASAARPGAARAAASAPMLGQARIDRMKNKGKTPPKPVKLIDINSAKAAELKTLPGIGDAEAERIIAGRPYLSKAQLVTKNILPAGPYMSLRTRIIAMQKTARPAPAAKAGSKG